MLLEFTVPGPPVSHQSRNKTKLHEWRQRVRASAAAVWGARAPVESRLKITVCYYHQGQAVRMDTDNIVKPIQDALIGVVYADDRSITDTVVRKTSVDGSFKIRGYSLVLLEAFARGDQFIHVVVDQAPSHETPLK